MAGHNWFDAGGSVGNVARHEPMMPDDASITILVPGVLRRESGGAAALRLRGVATLGEALAELERRRPALYRSVCDETGAVRRHVNLFVNTEHMRDRNGLDTPLAPGDEVIIMPAVSGG